MPQFDINKLVVLHLYNYVKPKGEQNPLSQVEKECQVVKVSTCMRNIYILNQDALAGEKQAKAYQALVDHLNKKDHYSGATKFERLDGQPAYEFLLYWLIGGINPKKLFCDDRIRGDVRNIWDKMITSTSVKTQLLVSTYNQLFQSLFTDSSQLADLVKKCNTLDISTCSRQMQRACQNCSWARANGFLQVVSVFNYDYFAQDTHLLYLRESLTLVQDRILNKAQLSSSGNVLFFKSKYAMTEEKLTGISLRLKTISTLLQRIEGLLQDKETEEGTVLESAPR